MDVSEDVSTFDSGRVAEQDKHIKVTEACEAIADVPGCDAGPARRLAFVLTEIRLAWRRRKSTKTSTKTSTETGSN